MLNNLKAKVLEQNTKDKIQTVFFIKNGFCQDWEEEDKTFNDQGIQRYCTDLRWEQYQSGKISREQIVRYTCNRAQKAADKRTAAKIEKIESVGSSASFSHGLLKIHYYFNKTWGFCPIAELHMYDANGVSRTYYGTGATGSGYDKTSMTVAGVFNNCSPLLKLLYDYMDQKNNDYYTGSGKWLNNYSELGCGSGYRVLPEFEGGTGLSSFWSILSHVGITAEQVKDDSHSTWYELRKEEEA